MAGLSSDEFKVANKISSSSAVGEETCFDFRGTDDCFTES